MDFSVLSTKQTLTKLKTSIRGLSETEAKARLKSYGHNEIRARRRFTLIAKILSPFKSAFVIVLLLGAALSWFIDHRADTIIILLVVLVNALIEWGQQISSSRVLASLKRYSAKSVAVRRGGKLSKIDASELVPGDIVLITEGEKIPADGRLIGAGTLDIDESVLTGESQPVTKNSATIKPGLAIYQKTNLVFSGTVVLSGRAEICVIATGNQTEFGQIAKLASLKPTPPPIYSKIKRLTLQLITITLAIAAIVIGLGLARGYDLVAMIRFAVALTVSVVPEGLPVTLSIIFLVGISKMAKQKALVRNLPTVETLGMVTAVATDKTGTLTQKSLSLVQKWAPGGTISDLDIRLSVSRGHLDLTHPIEKIITEIGQETAAEGWREVKDWPFDNKHRFTAVLQQKQQRYLLYVKGAPEIIIKKCRLTPKVNQQIHWQLNKMTKSGMRVIAIAKKTLPAKAAAKIDPDKLNGFEIVGLIGFSESLRTGVEESIALTKRAGIEVYLLTGDHLNTAQALGQKLALAGTSGGVIEGAQLAHGSESQWSTTLNKIRVFARVLPEHKYKILEILKRKHITAMTGDGVNDVPALVQADVGIAMGSGTDAAKESADMVLLDDNYSTIVRAIKAGRTIYANIQKMVYFLISTNVAEALTIIAALAVGFPLPLTAAQILWLNLVTDTVVVIPLGFEPPETDYMKRPPRPPKAPLLGFELASRMLLMAVVMAASGFGVFWLYLDHSPAIAQTMTFVTLSFVQWANVLNARSERLFWWQSLRKKPNPWLWLGLIAGILLVGLVIYGPLRLYLETLPIGPAQLAVVLIPIFLTLTVADLHKLWMRRRSG